MFIYQVHFELQKKLGLIIFNLRGVLENSRYVLGSIQYWISTYIDCTLMIEYSFQFNF
jgi:hypothetical protein